MKKSTVIAKCLVNSGFFSSLIEAEATVEKIYYSEQKIGKYVDWNKELEPQVAESLIGSVGRASQINVSKFIDELTD